MDPSAMRNSLNSEIRTRGGAPRGGMSRGGGSSIRGARGGGGGGPPPSGRPQPQPPTARPLPSEPGSFPKQGRPQAPPGTGTRPPPSGAPSPPRGGSAIQPGRPPRTGVPPSSNPVTALGRSASPLSHSSDGAVPTRHASPQPSPSYHDPSYENGNADFGLPPPDDLPPLPPAPASVPLMSQHAAPSSPRRHSFSDEQRPATSAPSPARAGAPNKYDNWYIPGEDRDPPSPSGAGGSPLSQSTPSSVAQKLYPPPRYQPPPNPSLERLEEMLKRRASAELSSSSNTNTTPPSSPHPAGRSTSFPNMQGSGGIGSAIQSAANPSSSSLDDSDASSKDGKKEKRGTRLMRNMGERLKGMKKKTTNADDPNGDNNTTNYDDDQPQQPASPRVKLPNAAFAYGAREPQEAENFLKQLNDEMEAQINPAKRESKDPRAKVKKDSALNRLSLRFPVRKRAATTQGDGTAGSAVDGDAPEISVTPPGTPGGTKPFMRPPAGGLAGIIAGRANNHPTYHNHDAHSPPTTGIFGSGINPPTSPTSSFPYSSPFTNGGDDGVLGLPPVDMPLPRKPETPFERRTKIMQEIVETERTYINSLLSLVQVYQQPLLEYAMSPDNEISKENITRLFSILPQIIPVNQELLARLGERFSSWNEDQIIGDVFVTMVPFLKMYKDYENNYETALDIYTKSMKDLGFKALVEDLDKQATSRMEATLIMPIQRIPRYKLLLEDMLKHTPPTHRDHPLVKQALAKVEEVANSIDEDLRLHEQRQRYLEISVDTGAVNLLAAHRKFLREGEITIIGTFGGGKLNVLLFNDIMVIFPKSKVSQITGDKRKVMLSRRDNQWPLELVWIKDDPTADTKNAYKFDITGPSRSFTCKFSTLEEKNSWLTDIKSAMVSTKNTQEGINSQLGDNRWGTYYFKNSVEYTGEWQLGKIHGHGVMKCYGTVYTGEFVQDKKSGYGKMMYSTGEIYEGDWKDDLHNGHGVMTYPTGDRYTGGWKAGKRSAKGKLEFENGDVYNGNWDENLPHGQGTLSCANGMTYVGGWFEGQFHGKGNLVLPTGRQYNGEWEAGLKQGIGVYKHYLNGDKTVVLEEYQGQWFQNCRNGRGTSITVHGKYTGDFVNDLREGQGRMEYADGSAYEGTWKRDQREGYGTYQSCEGRRIRYYEGEWKGDLKHGRGKLYYANGNVYEGQFKRDTCHGLGVFINIMTGEKFDGKWAKDIRAGPATVTFLRPEDEHQQQQQPSGEAAKSPARELTGIAKEPLLHAGKVFFPMPALLPAMQFDLNLI